MAAFSSRSIDDYTYEYATSDEESKQSGDDDGGSGEGGAAAGAGGGFVGWDHGVREESTRARARRGNNTRTDAHGNADTDAQIATGGSVGVAAAVGAIERQRSENAAHIGELPYGARPSGGVGDRGVSAPVHAGPLPSGRRAAPAAGSRHSRPAAGGGGSRPSAISADSDRPPPSSSGAAGGGKRMSRLAAMRAANADLGMTSGNRSRYHQQQQQQQDEDRGASSGVAGGGTKSTTTDKGAGRGPSGGEMARSSSLSSSVSSAEYKPPGSYNDVRARIASRYASGAGATGQLASASTTATTAAGSQPATKRPSAAMEIYRRRAAGITEDEIGTARTSANASTGTSRDRKDGGVNSEARTRQAGPSSPGRGDRANDRRTRPGDHSAASAAAATRAPAAAHLQSQDRANYDDDVSIDLFDDADASADAHPPGANNKPRTRSKASKASSRTSMGDDADVEQPNDTVAYHAADDDTSFEYSLPSIPSASRRPAAILPLDGSPNVGGESWSIRIRLISAADLPPSPSPHAPLCPLLKVGLVCAKDKEWYKSPTGSASASGSGPGVSRARDAESTSKLLTRLKTHGIDSIPSSRTRCSSHKILTPRDNGSIEWHEEMRWDDVLVTPPSSAANDLENSGIANVVVVVELCARSTLDPTPSAEEPDSLRSGSAHEAGEFEKASRAASGERMRIEDSGASAGEKHDRSPLSVHVGPDAQPLKKKRKFAQDLRLGTLVIPVTDLPLEDATHNRDGEAGKFQVMCIPMEIVIAFVTCAI